MNKKQKIDLITFPIVEEAFLFGCSVLLSLTQHK